jgi:molybdopterin molybdotransferase
VTPLTFEQARAKVIETIRTAAFAPTVETARLAECSGRVLAEDAAADRDIPALARSVRDGFAIRAADLPGELRVTGESRAGARFEGSVRAGEAVEIMTGAPLPEGADAVVMVEHTERSNGRVRIDRTAQVGDFINPRGCEAAAGHTILHAGVRLDYSSVAMLAALGRDPVAVCRKPSVAVVSTGDELTAVGETPRDDQIRDSNSFSLAAQVARAGGVPRILGPARDDETQTRETIALGLKSDLLLLSGGVSAGRYDVVETALAALGAEFFFDRVLIQPGQPLVFGRAQGTFFFGLPGNPASTMVTFEVFARAALELIAGQSDTSLFMPYARVAADFKVRPGLTRFLPASLSADGAEARLLPWSGSGDVPALTRANAYLVTDPERTGYAKGEMVRVLLK